MGSDDDGDGLQVQSSPTPRSSDRALALLTAVIETEGEPSLTQLSAQVDLAPSTASRQLASLEAAGMVARGATGYVVGPTMVRLAHRVVGARPVAQLAQPILDDLAAATGESAYLAVGHDDVAAIYVAAAEGTHHLRHAGWRGRTVPRATTAVGAALAGRTAVEHDAIETGITAIAVPVDGSDGTPMAIVLLGPTFRLGDAQLPEAITEVAGAAAHLSTLIGSPKGAIEEIEVSRRR